MVKLCLFCLLIYGLTICYYIGVRQRQQPLRKGSEELNEMTTAELNQYLENIAKLIEANAKDVETAAQIVRESEVKA